MRRVPCWARRTGLTRSVRDATSVAHQVWHIQQTRGTGLPHALGRGLRSKVKVGCAGWVRMCACDARRTMGCVLRLASTGKGPLLLHGVFAARNKEAAQFRSPKKSQFWGLGVRVHLCASDEAYSGTSNNAPGPQAMHHRALPPFPPAVLALLAWRHDARPPRRGLGLH